MSDPKNHVWGDNTVLDDALIEKAPHMWKILHEINETKVVDFEQLKKLLCEFNLK